MKSVRSWDPDRGNKVWGEIQDRVRNVIYVIFNQNVMFKYITNNLKECLWLDVLWLLYLKDHQCFHYNTC